MKIFCGVCDDFVPLRIDAFQNCEEEVQGEIICPICEASLALFQCDEEEWEKDPDPTGYYDLSKVPNYYPNGG